MKRTLSRILWSTALASSLLLAGCGKQEAAHVEQDNTLRPALVSASEPDPAKTTAPIEYEAKEESADVAGAPAPVDEKTVGRMQRAEAPTSIVAKPPGQIKGSGSEDYKNYGVNPLTETANDNQSTFAVDVDTASYAIARRKLRSGVVPPPASVRVEEFVNYFSYNYDGPKNANKPFAVHMDAAPSPFTKGRHILRVGVQGKKLSISERKPVNLVFLVDVSGSMSSPDKLGLAKRALRLMVSNLKDGDRVSMVTYAGNTRVVLESTKAENRGKIIAAIEDLNSGGSTDMGSGMDLAYKLAADGLAPGVESRVLVLSDGDANVGNTSFRDMLARIKGKVKEGVTMSTIGFGMGNYKDSRMEQLANKGNGNYYYIDSYNEAKKVFQEQLGGTLEVIAKDVKLQVEFDKEVVKRYRLVGYENRDIADHNFRNDKVDAGEIGAGHTVTAIYEVELARQDRPMAVVRVRHKQPKGSKATENAYAFDTSNLAKTFAAASPDLRFATAVVGAAEILRRSPHARGWTLDQVRNIAIEALNNDDRRKEFVELVGFMKRVEKKLAIAD